MQKNKSYQNAQNVEFIPFRLERGTERRQFFGIRIGIRTRILMERLMLCLAIRERLFVRFNELIEKVQTNKGKWEFCLILDFGGKIWPQSLIWISPSKRGFLA